MATLIERVFSGSDEMYEKAEKALAEAAAKYDDSTPVAYPDTAYYLECLYSMTGRKNQTLGELKESMKWIKEQMTRQKRTHDVFTSGVATACAAEVIEAVKYIGGVNPYEPTEMKMGSVPITISEVNDEYGRIRVRGKNFTEFSRILVNDEEMETIFVDAGCLVAEYEPGEESAQVCVQQMSATNRELGRTDSVELKP